MKINKSEIKDTALAIAAIAVYFLLLIIEQEVMK